MLQQRLLFQFQLTAPRCLMACIGEQGFTVLPRQAMRGHWTPRSGVETLIGCLNCTRESGLSPGTGLHYGCQGCSPQEVGEERTWGPSHHDQPSSPHLLSPLSAKSGWGHTEGPSGRGGPPCNASAHRHFLGSAAC